MAKKKKTATDKNVLTYEGIIKNPNDIDTFILDEIMRKFQSAKRFSRERIFEGKTREDITPITKSLFLDNSRYMRDALLEAEANISSQGELQPNYVKQYKKAIKDLNEKIAKLTLAKKKDKNEIIAKLESRIKKLTKNMNYYQNHIDNNTISKPVDGSKKLLKLLNKGKISKQDWRDARSNQIFSRGEANKKGNLNTRLEYVKDNIFKLGVINPFESKNGARLYFNVQFPDKIVGVLLDYLLSGKAYSIRVIREKGNYHVNVSLESLNETKTDFSFGCAGLDVNPDNVSVTIVHPNGNFKVSKVFWMEEITTVKADKRDWIIENTIIEAILWIKSFGVNALGIEALKFDQKHSTNSGYNRMIQNFAYSKIVSTIISTCFKENVAIIEVDAYYSSLIGRVKYQKEFGLSVHQAAAFVLARRAMGYKEIIPKDIMSILFAKEAKKGRKLFGLFTHWNKVSDWYSEEKSKLYKQKISYKQWFIDDFILHYKSSKIIVSIVKPKIAKDLFS